MSYQLPAVLNSHLNSLLSHAAVIRPSEDRSNSDIRPNTTLRFATAATFGDAGQKKYRQQRDMYPSAAQGRRARGGPVFPCAAKRMVETR